MVEIPHGVSFEERQKDLLQKKTRPSRLSRFLSSTTKGKVTDTKPLQLFLVLIIILVLGLYLISLFKQKSALGQLVAPEGYKIIYSKEAPPRLEIKQ